MRLFDFINDEKRLFADRRFSWPACTLHRLVIAPAKTQSRSGDTSLARREHRTGFSRGCDDNLQPGMPIPGITERVVFESRATAFSCSNRAIQRAGKEISHRGTKARS